MGVGVTMARETFTHKVWSRYRLLDAVRPLEPALLREPMAMGQVSLLRTVEHLLMADVVWVSALEGDASVVVGQDEYESIEEIEAAWPAVDARWKAYIDTLTESKLDETVRRTSKLLGRTYEVRVRDVVLHVSTHHMYTLAQAANMVRKVGGEAPATGYALWAVEGRDEDEAGSPAV